MSSSNDYEPFNIGYDSQPITIEKDHQRFPHLRKGLRNPIDPNSGKSLIIYSGQERENELVAEVRKSISNPVTVDPNSAVTADLEKSTGLDAAMGVLSDIKKSMEAEAEVLVEENPEEVLAKSLKILEDLAK